MFYRFNVLVHIFIFLAAPLLFASPYPGFKELKEEQCKEKPGGRP
jgi:hypothetical protein